MIPVPVLRDRVLMLCPSPIITTATDATDTTGTTTATDTDTAAAMNCPPPHILFLASSLASSLAASLAPSSAAAS